MPRKERKWEAVSRVGRPLLNRGLDFLPQRIQWSLMSLLGVNLPDPKNEDLWRHGSGISEKVLRRATEYREGFTIEDRNVLEIGCGPGRILVPMAAAGASAYGIDISPSNLRRAKTFAAERDTSVTVARAEQSIPFDERFSFIYSFATFMHLPRRVVIRYLIESRDHLDDDGICCFVFRNLDHPRSRAALKSDLDKRYTARVRYHAPDEVRNYMDMAEFSNVSIVRDDENHAQLFVFGEP